MIYFDSQLAFCLLTIIYTVNIFQNVAYASIDVESESPFKEGIHNGKFVIYDHLDRQMVESSIDQMIADEDDSSYPMYTKVLPDFKLKDTQSVHDLPSSAAKNTRSNLNISKTGADNSESNSNKSKVNPFLTMEKSFGYRLSNNHQIQGKRPKVKLNDDDEKKTDKMVKSGNSDGSSNSAKSKFDSFPSESNIRSKIFLKPLQNTPRPVFGGGSSNGHNSNQAAFNLRPVPYRPLSRPLSYDYMGSESISSAIRHQSPYSPSIPILLSTSSSSPFPHNSAGRLFAPGYHQHHHISAPSNRFEHYRPVLPPPTRQPTSFANFYHHDMFEDMAASESQYTPEDTRTAVRNHPELTVQQRDTLLKILESYYRLIHQFNIDFRKMINESRQRSEQKRNTTIVLEPLKSAPSEPVPSMMYIPKPAVKNYFYRGDRIHYLT
ncbi:uncharacterized protein LOC141849680 [Brevipalpus obovatus]|uniref:uncharacterized protein LOC141849680 n=1 Tax=Brevipalpus obovatus TaxID=246614 RepID=UPI003D9E22FD